MHLVDVGLGGKYMKFP